MSLQRHTPLKRTELKRKRPLQASPGVTQKRKKPRRKSVASDPTWKEICALWSKIVRAPGRCVFEGMDGVTCSDVLNCMHLKSRRFSSIHTDPENCVCGCVAHHYHYTNHPDLFYLAIERLYPGRWASIQEKLNAGIKPRKHEYVEIYDRLLKEFWRVSSEAA